MKKWENDLKSSSKNIFNLHFRVNYINSYYNLLNKGTLGATESA